MKCYHEEAASWKLRRLLETDPDPIGNRRRVGEGEALPPHSAAPSKKPPQAMQRNLG